MPVDQKVTRLRRRDEPQPQRFVIKRLPRDDDELWWTVQALWGYKFPRTSVCANHCSPFEAFADAYFAKSPVAIWKASRGFGGKSRTLGVLGLTEMALLGAEVSVLGGSGAQSLNVHATSQEAWRWHNSPRALLTSAPTKFDTFLTNGGHMRTLMASQTSVRGPHPQRLRLDEIDEMDQAILEGAQGQPMRKMGPHGRIETHTVMSSTHQYPDKTMTAMLGRAKESGWPVFEWCWRETANPVDGWLTHDEVERKRKEIPQHMWETEYDLQEPNVEGRAIDGDAVERYFDTDLGSYKGDKVVTSEPVRGRAYITSVDWAKERDQTIVSTWDTTSLPWVCVAWRKVNKLPWPVMVKMAIEQWDKFGGKLTHDATGIGNVVDDLIKEELPRHKQKLVYPVVMGGGRERSNLFSEYIAAIEHDDLRSPRIEYAYDEHRYVTVDDLYGKGHPPDSVVSGALAWRLRSSRITVGMPGGGTKQPGFAI